MATFELIVEGQTFVVEVGDVSQSPVTVVVNGMEKTVDFRNMEAEVSMPSESTASPAQAAAPAKAAPAPAPQPSPAPAEPVPAGAVSGEVIVAPMPGKILAINVSVGDSISEGQSVCTLEAMKMEMPISATASGTVKAIHVAEGESVANDDPLITVE